MIESFGETKGEFKGGGGEQQYHQGGKKEGGGGEPRQWRIQMARC